MSRHGRVAPGAAGAGHGLGAGAATNELVSSEQDGPGTARRRGAPGGGAEQGIPWSCALPHTRTAANEECHQRHVTSPCRA